MFRDELEKFIPKGEPDEFAWEHNGLPCLVVRQFHGALCGYVGLKTAPFEDYYSDAHYEVHGGVTYGDWNDRYDQDYARLMNCELEKYLWVGFDTCHSGDLVPKYHHTKLGKYAPLVAEMSGDDIYRDLEYMKKETNHLVDQIKAEQEK